MEFTRVSLAAQPYIFVERECAYDGPQIALAMGSAFAEVFGFVSQHRITPASAPISVYLGMDPAVLRFRGGVLVSATDAAKASGAVKADALPGGDAMTVTHVGPYASLNQTHRALWDHMEDAGIPGTFPIWEVYVDDPQTTDDDKLRTEVYRAVSSA